MNAVQQAGPLGGMLKSYSHGHPTSLPEWKDSSNAAGFSVLP
jgi:hypothetical protein